MTVYYITLIGASIYYMLFIRSATYTLVQSILITVQITFCSNIFLFSHRKPYNISPVRGPGVCMIHFRLLFSFQFLLPRKICTTLIDQLINIANITVIANCREPANFIN